MSSTSVLDLWREAIATMATVAAPFLITCLAVGLLVSIIQTATQLQESILAFLPKLVAALVVLALGGHWCLDKLGKYTKTAFTSSANPTAVVAPAMDTGLDDQ